MAKELQGPAPFTSGLAPAPVALRTSPSCSSPIPSLCHLLHTLYSSLTNPSFHLWSRGTGTSRFFLTIPGHDSNPPKPNARLTRNTHCVSTRRLGTGSISPASSGDSENEDIYSSGCQGDVLHSRAEEDPLKAYLPALYPIQAD